MNLMSLVSTVVWGVAGVAGMVNADVVYTPVSNTPALGATVDVDGDGLVDFAFAGSATSSGGSRLVVTPSTDWSSPDWNQWRTCSMLAMQFSREPARVSLQDYGAVIVDPSWGGGWGEGGGWGGGWGGSGWFWTSQSTNMSLTDRAGNLYLPVRIGLGETLRYGWIELHLPAGGSVSEMYITGYAIETTGARLQMGDRGCTFGPPALVNDPMAHEIVVPEGQSAAMYVEVSGAVSATVWKRNGQPLNLGGPSEVWIEENGMLHVDRARSADAGRYTLEAVNSCGTSVSLPITLLVTPPEPSGSMLTVVDAPQYGKRYALIEPSVAQWAASSARALGGELVTIQSAEENEFVRERVLTFDGISRDGWIGLIPTGLDSAAWRSGQTLGFTNWKQGEPNGWLNGEDAVEMYGADGLWNDLASYNGLHGIVELPLGGSGMCRADIGGAGGLAVRDYTVDVNDIIVFIDGFFQRDPRSDVGSQGGMTAADGEFDNNDFIVYINLFFAGC